MNINGIEDLGLDRVLKRGSGEILAHQEQALLVRDSVSGAYLLACKDRETGLPLQRCLIARSMGQGFLPFAQVETDNQTSLRLQKKLGMTRSDRRIVWMWKVHRSLERQQRI